MEDEECLPENSSLKLYLQNLGFSDFHVTRNTSKSSNFRFEVAKQKSKQIYMETIDEDVIELINIIVSTRMLFEEDVSCVEKLLSNFRVVKNGIFKSMFKDLFSMVIIFVGLCLYWFIGHCAFFIVSSFYAFMAADYLRRKHFNRERLKKLSSVLQTNFKLLKKTFNFIEENKLIELKNSCESNSEFMEGFDFYRSFKSEFLVSLNEMISILAQSTQKLINQLPLHDYIENPKYYMCNNFNKNDEIVDLSKLYGVYLLVQSEFLQRLILSLVPNIKLCAKDSFHDLNKILTETCISLLKIKNKLSKKYKFLFLNGIHTPKVKVDFKLALKNKSDNNNYSNEFFLCIHEASKTLQKLLIQCRTLEEKIMSEKYPEYLENELVLMLSDIHICQRNINDGLILYKKTQFITKCPVKYSEPKLQKEVHNSTDEFNKVVVGYTELESKIEDEIFEASFTDEKSSELISDVEDWNLDNNVEKKVAKEYSENVLKELKLKLVEKAKYWKKRERELLMKKGIIDLSEENEQLENEKNSASSLEVVSDVEKVNLKMPFDCQKTKPETNHTRDEKDLEMISNNEGNENIENFFGEYLPEVSTKFHISEISHSEDFKDSESIEQKISEDSKFDNTYESCLPTFHKEFLNDLNQARKKIFNLSFAVKEQLFYGSGEESFSDDNFTE